MRISNISNYINFGRVYAVAGTREQVEELKAIVNRSRGDGFFLSATHIYKDRKSDGLCTEAAKQGNEIAFVVAGKEDVEKVSFMHPGWSSVNGISNHIDRFIQLSNVKEQAKAIQRAMKKS